MKLKTTLKKLFILAVLITGQKLSAQAFSWAAYVAGSLTYSNLNITLLTPVTMDVSAAASGSGLVLGSPSYVPGLTNYLHTRVNWSNRTTTFTYTITFSDPVQGPTFDVFDVDYSSSNHDDRVTITGTNASGTTIYPSIIASSFNYVGGANNNRISGSSKNTSFNNDPANVSFGANYVKTITIVYTSDGGGPVNPGNQEIGIGNIGFISVLPVQLTSFTASKKQNEDVQLQWSSAEEKNTHHFEIERAGDDQQFVKIGEMQAAGNSTVLTHYSFVDAKARHGNNFYRLRIVHNDMSVGYSKIVMLNVVRLNMATVFPMPFSDHINLNTNAEAETRVLVKISNMSGQVVFSRELDIPEGSSSTAIYGLAGLNKGIYMLNVTDMGGQWITASKLFKD